MIIQSRPTSMNRVKVHVDGEGLTSKEASPGNPFPISFATTGGGRFWRIRLTKDEALELRDWLIRQIED